MPRAQLQYFTQHNMLESNKNLAQRKIYFLRLKRFVTLLQNYTKDDLWLCWLGRITHNSLIQSETFEVLSPSARSRVMAMVWIFLSRHQFTEAARVLKHTIHSYSTAPTWIWRVAFHIFRCLGNPDGLYTFKRAMNEFRSSDENNRMLETILFQMSQRKWKEASEELSTKQFGRDRNASKPLATREPEMNFVQRLQRLYEGLSYYAQWRDPVKTFDEEKSAMLAEKATYRLSEVEAMIGDGHVCDIFLHPLVELLISAKKDSKMLSLLNMYVNHLPSHPNAHRYLAEWYLTQLGHSFNDLEEVRRALCLKKTKDQVVLKEEEPDEEDKIVEAKMENEEKTQLKLRKPSNMNNLLFHMVQYSLLMLPEIKPEENVSESIHLIIIESCLKRGFGVSAMELSFKLLDDPSWADCGRAWKFLHRAINMVGLDLPALCEAWALRKRTWRRYIFRYPHVHKESLRVQHTLKRVIISSTSELDTTIDTIAF